VRCQRRWWEKRKEGLARLEFRPPPRWPRGRGRDPRLTCVVVVGQEEAPCAACVLGERDLGGPEENLRALEAVEVMLRGPAWRVGGVVLPRPREAAVRGTEQLDGGEGCVVGIGFWDLRGERARGGIPRAEGMSRNQGADGKETAAAIVRIHVGLWTGNSLSSVWSVATSQPHLRVACLWGQSTSAAATCREWDAAGWLQGGGTEARLSSRSSRRLRGSLLRNHDPPGLLLAIGCLLHS